MTKRGRMEHQRIGFISPDGREITGYAHERHNIGECPWCDFVRAEQIAREFLRRMEVINERFEHLNMWSLGTSLRDTVPNRKLLLRWWNRFTTRVRKSGYDWSAVFRVVEVGNRGYLHIHFVCYDYLPHAFILETWRSLTGQRSNVHVSGQKGCQDAKRLVRYLTKYLTKENTSYRWLGRFYGLGRERSRRVRNVESDSVYGGICYGGYFTDAYKNDDRVVRLPVGTPSQGGDTNGKQSRNDQSSTQAED